MKITTLVIMMFFFIMFPSSIILAGTYSPPGESGDSDMGYDGPTGAAANLTEDEIRKKISEAYKSLENSEYLWGGVDKDGVDCRGTIYYGYNSGGYKLELKTAQGYHDMAEPILRYQLKGGDIITYSVNGKIIHIQGYVGKATETRSGKVVDDGVINAGGEKNGVYIVSLKKYINQHYLPNSTPHYGRLLK